MSRGEAAADALLRVCRLLTGLVPGAWTRAADGAEAVVFGVADAALNFVLPTRADSPAVAELLDAVAATGLPYGLLARPGSETLAGLAALRDMERAEDLPLLVLDRLERPAAASLSVRALDPGEAPLCLALQAAAFDAPVAWFEGLSTARVLSAPAVGAYVGEVDGEPVATAMSVAAGDAVKILNVATLAAHRRRGYGAAITARAVADGLDAGAAWAFLQSSRDGRSVYERLGFRTVETWATYQKTLSLSQSAAK